MNKKRSIKDDQKGMIAIAVTIIILGIVSLIVIGFASISRREQRQALDRQLSTEAYYAAESGINHLAELMRTGNLSGDFSDCDSQPAAILTNKNLASNVEYTCALIRQAVEDVTFVLPENTSRVLRLTTTENIHAVQIEWQDENNTTGFACNNNHYLPQGDFTSAPENQYNNLGVLCAAPPAADRGAFSNSTPIIRSTIIPITGSFTRSDLVQQSPTYFLYPKRDTDANPANNNASVQARRPIATPVGDGSQGDFLDGQCNAASSYYCKMRITHVDTNLAATNTMYLRLRSIYRGANIKVTLYNALGNPLPINGSQAVIDVTARAEDVVKRIQARVPLDAEFYFPEFGVQTAHDLCKKFTVLPGSLSYNPYSDDDLKRADGALNIPPNSTGANDVDIDKDRVNLLCNPAIL